MFYVFDAKKSQGYLIKVPFRWMAHAAAKLAGRNFDYSTVTFKSDADFARLQF